MKITLVWPLNTSYAPSLSLLYQAKILEKEFDVDVVYTNLLFSNDLLSTPKEFEENPKSALKHVIKTVESTKPNFVFVGSWREHIPFVARFCDGFKSRNPNTTLIVGGHTPTFLPDEILGAIPSVDYIVRGEAEYSLLELVKTILSKKKLNEIPGLSFKDESGNIVHTGGVGRVHKLDELPYIDFENIKGHKIPARIDLRTQRGCWGVCSFCSLPNLFGMQRYHSLEYVINQIKHLENLYDFDYFHLLDENFLSNITRSKKIACEISTQFPDLEWGGMFRADVVSENVIKELSSNNFIRAAVGIESNNAKVLKYLGKTSMIEQYINRLPKIIEILSENLRFLEFGMIMGTPVENKEDLEDLLKFIKTMKSNKPSTLEALNIALGRLIVYPGTKLYTDYSLDRLELFKPSGPYENSLEEEIVSKYDDFVWAVPWRYFIRNRNFNTIEEHMNALKNVFLRLN